MSICIPLGFLYQSLLQNVTALLILLVLLLGRNLHTLKEYIFPAYRFTRPTDNAEDVTYCMQASCQAFTLSLALGNVNTALD